MQAPLILGAKTPFPIFGAKTLFSFKIQKRNSPFLLKDKTSFFLAPLPTQIVTTRKGKEAIRYVIKRELPGDTKQMFFGPSPFRMCAVACIGIVSVLFLFIGKPPAWKAYLFIGKSPTWKVYLFIEKSPTWKVYLFTGKSPHVESTFSKIFQSQFNTCPGLRGQKSKQKKINYSTSLIMNNFLVPKMCLAQ